MPQHTDEQPKAFKPALESMTLLVAAVIVHDEAPAAVAGDKAYRQAQTLAWQTEVIEAITDWVSAGR